MKLCDHSHDDAAVAYIFRPETNMKSYFKCSKCLKYGLITKQIRLIVMFIKYYSVVSSIICANK